MSVMEFNRIAGAILMTLTVIKVADILGDATGHVEPLAKPAYMVEGAAEAAAKPGEKEPAKPAEQLAAIGPLLASANADRGKTIARKCQTCHDLSKGRKVKIGPPLWGIVGMKKGEGSFAFSDALKKLGGVWDYASLNAFIHDPKAVAPGTKMSFPGVKNDKDRAALILYLRSLSDNPAPLP